MQKLLPINLILIILFSSILYAQNTINIPGDYPTIQAGINAADSGDVVLVAEGEYFENINFRGKAITVASHFFVDSNKAHIENTIINGSQPSNTDSASVVAFGQGEDTTSVLCGFRITGGYGTIAYNFRCGGGIFIEHTSPKILNNIVEQNIIDTDLGAAGGGVLADIILSPLIIEGNIIRDNIAKSTTTSSHGGGISIWSHLGSNSGEVFIRHNLVENNQVISPSFNNGGGISVYGYDAPNFYPYIIGNKIIGNFVDTSITDSYGGGMTLVNTHAYTENNIIAYNVAYDAAGIDNANLGGQSNTYYINNTFCYNHAVGEEGGISTFHLGQMINCIVWGNTPQQFTPWSQVLSISYSLIEELYPGSGNIVGNPFFLDSIYFFMDPGLTQSIDNGNPDAIYNDIEDPNKPGFALFPAQGTLRNDIGHFGGPHSNWANVLSDTLYVPVDYSTIQEAIDAAVNGNVVLVADGTYYENINYKGKAITVASHFLVDGNESHIENTIIDGSQPSHPDSGSVVSFFNGEDTTSVLCGFTITGGTGIRDTEYPNWMRSGGGIFTDSAGAKIINNIITGNSIIQDPPGTFDLGGGGILVNSVNNNIIIRDNVIKENYAQGYYTFGAAIALWSEAFSLVENNIISNNQHNSSLTQGGGIHTGIGNHKIINNFFSNNSAISQSSNSGGGGGAIYTISPGSMDFSPLIANNLIVHNEATQGGGIKIWTSNESIDKGVTKNRDELKDLREGMTFNPVVENNTIIFNTSPGAGGGIRNYNTPTEIRNNIIWGNDGAANLDQISGTGQEIVTYSNIQGSYTGEGNINEDPMFDDTTFYCLNQYSPCVDAGNPDPMYNDVEDPLTPGFPRLPARGTLINDMGCFGGPNSLWCNWDIPVSVKGDKTKTRVPTEFTLEQNYPNPFNPTTTIKYGIPERLIVELKVYNALGQEVITLVNQEQDTGYYEVNFDAAHLSSGVYFYQIKAGDYIETKKMLLLK